MDRSTNDPSLNQVFQEGIGDIEQLFEDENQYQPMATGKMFGRYQIQGELGRGGMGVVYKALDTKLNMTVALKVIMTEESSQSIERFKREAFATAKLDHPNIIRFFDVGESPKPYFTMEYIEGYTLAHFIKEKKIKLLLLVDIIIKVCDALYHAHKKNILHRDLKPSNIMLTKDGIPKIMDFGLAKITETTMQTLSKSGQILGTMHYMAPEQVNGEVTYKSDIYSIGATIYEALTYKTVFQGDTHMNLLYQILQENPIPPRELKPDISPYMEAICLKCLSKNEDKRYDDFKQLERELKNFKGHRPIIAKKYTQWDVVKNVVNKNKILCVSIFLIIIILFASAIYSYRQKNNAEQQKEIANNARKKADNALKAKKQANKKLIIEKEKTDKANEKLFEANKDLTALNEAIIESLEYARTTDNYKYNKLFEDKGFLDPVRKVFNRSSRLQNAEEYRFLRGLILGQSQKKQDISQAIDDYTKEIQKYPKFAQAYNNRGNLYYSQGKYKLAGRDFNTAIELDPKDAYAYYNRGNLYYSQEKYELAERDFNTAIELNPKHAHAYNNRGLLYARQRKYNLAERDFNKAIKLNPKFTEAYNNRGFLYNMKGTYKLAERDLNKAIDLNPKYTKAYGRRGLLYANQGKYNLAIADWKKAISLGAPKVTLQPFINTAKQQLIKQQK